VLDLIPRDSTNEPVSTNVSQASRELVSHANDTVSAR
jgi:hypothetical protein